MKDDARRHVHCSCTFLRFMLLVSAMMTVPLAAQGAEVWTYIGTYTVQASKGIYLAKFDMNTGKFGKPVLAAATENPSFVAIHPNKKFLYAVGEVGQYKGEATGFVRAFAIGSDGKLKQLNTRKSAGAAPCHLVVDKAGKSVLVANYSSGTVTSIAIQSDGQLGDIVSTHQHTGSSVTARQKASHAHSINLDAANRFAFAADLGADKVYIYAFDPETGKLSTEGAPDSATQPPWIGPATFRFSS